MPDQSKKPLQTSDHLTYDAIVIGSGISGGWAAKELCELGLKTLVLERGRNVEHIKDYPTATLDPWQFKHRGQMTREFLGENPLISKAAGFGEDDAHFFIKDKDHPYIQEKPFDWIRGYQVGGKSLTWGRACQRWSKYEFTNPERFGYGIAWPIGYDDVAPWYSHVEKFIGVCGNKDGIEAMPDGEFLPPFDMNCVQEVISKKISENYPDRHLVHARWAHLTKPNQLHLDQGRGKCQARNICMRGCPFGGYFSSVSSTLPWAKRTGNLTVRPFSVVHSVIYDEKLGKATGVKVIDTNTKEVIEYKAKIIFMNASALNTNLILLNSTSARFPNGLGNDNGLLGKYVAFQNYRASVTAGIDGFLDRYYFGRNPTELILANYRNLQRQETDYKGGFTTFMGAYRHQHPAETATDEIGGDYKDSLTEPGGWQVYMYLQGETVPKESNHVRLSKDQKDQWGIPLLITSVEYDDNDERMIQDFLTQSADMLQKAGCTNIEKHENKQAPGLDIHEMGGVRMGKDPKTSLLNQWNQLHLCKNVFVTDGACMTSTGNQSPSILYMALTARAANYAAGEIKKGNL
ncbi:Choline dehydrogenase [Mucilaginibacter lappiensis]|uniref:Choline dehydrogenase-like flavoprotein n=1 Tax=Mucilaginibacter lappiensis TaxID=354630 RepID=A0ABR6PU91_9SPHI|nr:GMC family oxidoreductase [Mucilaginibacter lappiensis]MBB6112724.1 choline dehydrogenase-like flavoprotein [Mucilaginibacter lappiensis]SIS05942.1 Choline dehydrogenase [Mucilaginibacter lappiensis]